MFAEFTLIASGFSMLASKTALPRLARRIAVDGEEGLRESFIAASAASARPSHQMYLSCYGYCMLLLRGKTQHVLNKAYF
jgi:hypothetical protein